MNIHIGRRNEVLCDRCGEPIQVDDPTTILESGIATPDSNDPHTLVFDAPYDRTVVHTECLTYKGRVR